MKVACVVLTYNVYTLDRVKEFRTTLETISEPGWPVFVVDNGSDDDTRQLVERLGGWRNDGPNRTIGAGWNLAVDCALNADPDIVVYSNDDMRYRPGWGDQLTALWQAAPDDLIVVSGLIERWVWSWNRPVAAHTYGGVRVLEQETVPGGCWTFRARDWPQIGPIPDNDNSWTDVPVSRRLREQGWRIAAADWTDHLAYQKSAWGNQTGVVGAGEPLDYQAWGLRDRRDAAPGEEPGSDPVERRPVAH